MPFEIIHFRGADDLLKEKGMENDLQRTLEYLDNVLYGSIHRRELLREALSEMGWRNNRDLSILAGRRYYYKGIKQRVAIEGNFALYEYILEGLFRLQIGHEKEMIDVGILLLNGQRGDKTPYGSTRQLVEEEIKDLYPIIDLPVAVCLFDLGKPGESIEQEVQAGHKETEQKDIQPKDKKETGTMEKEKEPDPNSQASKVPGDQKANPSKRSSAKRTRSRSKSRLKSPPAT